MYDSAFRDILIDVFKKNRNLQGLLWVYRSLKTYGEKNNETPSTRWSFGYNCPIKDVLTDIKNTTESKFYRKFMKEVNKE